MNVVAVLSRVVRFIDQLFDEVVEAHVCDDSQHGNQSYDTDEDSPKDHMRRLTLDMSGGWKRAKHAGGRPLDGRVRAHRGEPQ